MSPRPEPEPGSRTPEVRGGTRFALIVALVVFTLGLWLFFDARGAAVPPLARWWPGFVALGGLASLLDYLVLSRRPASLGQAVLGLGLAAILFAFTLDYAGWRDLLDVLPAVPTLVGLAMIAGWAAGPRTRNAPMVGGVTLVALGLVGFAARFEWLQRMLPSAQVVWAVLLVVGGGVLVWRAFARSES